jgi:hypothetical protein
VTRLRPGPAWLFPGACALAFLLAHLPWLASSLEDVDSVNFALALDRFDVAAHRPHPPGYPVFVALGKVARPLAAATLPAAAPVEAVGARTLSLIGVIAGALLAFPLLQLFRMIERHETRARLALVLTLACPLTWFTAARPLSDTAGLLALLSAQALLLTAWQRQRGQAGGTAPALDRQGLIESGRLIVAGALLSGIAVGVRSQTAWLTLPMLALVLGDRAGRDAAGALLGSMVTFSAGVLVWAVPLIWISGGPGSYLRALTAQAAEDLSGVDMLARNPTPQRLLSGLVDTFVEPWATWWIALPVIGFGLLGALALLRRSTAALLVFVAAFVPYAAFHLTLQETFTTRYALPLVPVMAYLAVRGLAAAGTLAATAGTVVVSAASLALAVPALAAYSGAGSPVARAVGDLREGLAGSAPRGRALMMNHPFSVALRGETFDADLLPSVRRQQWLEVVKYWTGGGTKPVWFLAEPGVNGLERHHELALIDPSARVLRRSYRWPFDPVAFVGGARPSEVDWYELHQPGWFAGDGWALTPELAGSARLSGHGPGVAPITAYVRRRQEAAVVVVGGRNLGGAGAPEVQFDLAVEGRVVRSWRVPPMPGFFLDLFTLDPGSTEGDGAFAALTVAATAADGSGRSVEAAIEQFDLQPLDSVVYGFDTGWHEMEYSPATGELWRWMADTAAVRVHAPGRALRCTVRGASPLLHYDRPSRLAVRAGSRVLGELEPAADFSWDVEIPADALAEAGGVLTLSVDQSHVPDETIGNGDRRRLGLRILDLRIAPAATESR